MRLREVLMKGTGLSGKRILLTHFIMIRSETRHAAKSIHSVVEDTGIAPKKRR